MYKLLNKLDHSDQEKRRNELISIVIGDKIGFKTS